MIFLPRPKASFTTVRPVMDWNYWKTAPFIRSKTLIFKYLDSSTEVNKLIRVDAVWRLTGHTDVDYDKFYVLFSLKLTF